MRDQAKPQLLIPRPRAQAEAFAAALEAAAPGLCAAIIAPVFRIAYLSPPLELEGVSDLVFTSANGVEGFARLSPRRDLVAHVVGDATADKARALGFRVETIAADVADLIPRLPGEGRRLLYARGLFVSADLGGEETLGRRLTEAVVYEQAETALPGDVSADLLAGRIAGVVVMSPRTARRLFVELGRAPVPDAVKLFCLSSAVAAACSDLRGFPLISRTPDAAGLIDLISASFRR